MSNVEASLSESASPPRQSVRPSERQRNAAYLAALVIVTILGVTSASLGNAPIAALGLGSVLFASTAFCLLLAIKSILDFTQTGPKLKDEILKHYRHYTAFAFLRMLGFAFLVLSVLAGPGVLTLFAVGQLSGMEPGWSTGLLSSTLSVLLLGTLQFSRHLLWLPANITASYNYRTSRLYPVWRALSPARLRLATWGLLGIPVVLTAASTISLLVQNEFFAAAAFASVLGFYIILGLWLRNSEPAAKRPARSGTKPNILLIGSDTLRADRVDGSYPKNVAPYLTSLAARGVMFSQCYVPCARTAPSLLSLLTGYWPHRFSVRDNFVPDSETHLPVTALPRLLKQQGYYTAALADWCGADMGKFDLGFDYADVPEDQWNIKLFIRQGPKDLRLFLSLFARNRFGKCFLPEVYYLGGVPQTDEMGREARHLISHLASQEQPFFLNIFFSTTHGPFGSEYPYYTRYATPDYRGESKFVMSRLTDPWEIIRRQAEPREAFDLDQILNLYDGCVTRFDDEVGRIMAHLERNGLAENTIVVIYSDHGMEFFEHGTWGQGNSTTSDVSSRIPLLIRAPGMSHGHIVTQPVRSIDLAPTLLELAGIDLPTEMDGLSLGPFLQDAGANTDRDIFSETGIWLTNLPGTPAGHIRYPNLLDLLTVRDIATGTISLKPDLEELVIRAKDRMIRHGHWKLVYQPLDTGHILKLFDLQQDPACSVDLADQYPLIVTDLWDRLHSWICQGHDPMIKRSLTLPFPEPTGIKDNLA